MIRHTQSVMLICALSLGPPVFSAPQEAPLSRGDVLSALGVHVIEGDELPKYEIVFSFFLRNSTLMSLQGDVPLDLLRSLGISPGTQWEDTLRNALAESGQMFGHPLPDPSLFSDNQSYLDYQEEINTERTVALARLFKQLRSDLAAQDYLVLRLDHYLDSFVRARTRMYLTNPVIEGALVDRLQAEFDRASKEQ